MLAEFEHRTAFLDVEKGRYESASGLLSGL
jgi:hypothetical protein